MYRQIISLIAKLISKINFSILERDHISRTILIIFVLFHRDVYKVEVNGHIINIQLHF